MGEPQTLRDSAWTRMEERIEAMPPGIARTAALMDMNLMLSEHRDALRAALASSDSLRLDPEDPESVERLARALDDVQIADYWEPSPAGDWGELDDGDFDCSRLALAIAREWKASALPDPEVTK